MLVQMLILLVVSKDRRVEYFNSQASESFGISHASVNETIESLKGDIVSLSQEQNTLNILFSKNVTRQNLVNFNRSVNSISAKTPALRSIYIYNPSTNTVYKDNMSFSKFDTLADSRTKDIILSNYNNTKKMFSFVDKEAFLVNPNAYNSDDTLRTCYFPSKKSGGCIIFDINIESLVGMFDSYRKNFSSEILVTSNGELSFGTGSSSIHTAFSDDIKTIENNNYNSPVFHILNGEEYLVLKKSSKISGFDIYSLIPYDSIPNTYPETTMLFSVNMSLIALFCLAVVLIFLLKNFNQAFKENATLKRLQSEEQMNKQFAQKKQCLINCLVSPNEKDFLAAEEYINSHPGNSEILTKINRDDPTVSLLRIEIDNFKSFCEANSPQDIRLYKYGIVNICNEILNSHTRALLVYERNEETVFLIIDKENTSEKCRKAFEECHTAIQNYINTDIFAFHSDLGCLTELPTLNSQTLSMSEYMFMLDEACFLTSADIKTETSVTPREATELLDAIFTATGETERDSCFAAFFDSLNGVRPEEAKNLLWVLLFRLHNVGKRNLADSEGIEALVARFNDNNKLSEMYDFFSAYCNAVFPSVSTEEPTDRENTVQAIQAIIERSYRRPDFCSDHIADEMKSSKVYLSRKYKNLTGYSISEEILNRRMTAFADELVNTDKSIKDIIFDVGGANYNYYMALFKKRFSMTPTEYRKKNKNSYLG